MKNKKILLFLVFFVTVVAAGTVSAADNTEAGDQGQLAVTSINPANNTMDVPAGDPQVIITFNNPIEEDSAYYETSITNAGTSTPVDITNSIDGNKLILTPYTTWMQDTTYNIYIPFNAVKIKDSTGNLATAYTSTFKTAPPITVTDINPADNAVNVPVNSPNPNVTITFSSPIQIGSAYYDAYILNTKTNTHISVTNSINDNKLTMIPDNNWVQDTTYKVCLPPHTVTDQYGNTIDTYQSTFTTAKTLLVTSIDPANNATNVPNSDKTITITFNSPIQAGSAYYGIYVVDCAYNSFKEITKSINGNKLTITAENNWTSSIYALYMYPDAVTDEYGNTLATPFYSTFSNIDLTHDSSIPSTGTPDPCIILTFDDNFVSHYYQDMPYLSGKGLNPTFFVNAGLFGNGAPDDVISSDQVIAMAADGWLIANHTWDHALLSTLTEAQQESEILQNQAWILAHTNGLGAYIFATPGGDANSDTITALANTGMRFCRGDLSFGPVWNPNLDDGTTTIMGLPIENFNTMDLPSDAATKMLNLIAEFFANNQSVIILIHQVTDTPQPNSTDISTADFHALIDGIVAAGYNCKNPDQWLNEWKITDPTPLTVNNATPANNAHNVSVTATTVTITFNRSIQAASAYNDICIRNTVNNTLVDVTKFINGNTLTITAASNWILGTNYTVYIPTSAITDLRDNALTAAYNSTFTTENEKIPPTVTGIDPVSNAVNVPANKVIQVTFSEAIKAGSNFWIDLKNSTGTIIPITKTINGNTLTITPTNNLPESKYTLTLHTNSITDIAGNPLTLYTTKFTTGTPPTVTLVDPVSNAVNVPANKVIQVTFSEAIKAGSNFWIDLKNSTGTIIPITKTINGNTLTITPTNNLPESKYTLTLHTNSITDIAGNPLTLYTTKFTTGTPPTVTLADPASNAVNVPANKVIQVTFSEAIKAGSNFWIDLKNSTGTIIPITKTINGNTLTITPTNNLPESKYTLTLHTNSITDIAGNPLTLYTTKFTTGTPPTVTLVDPVSNAVNVPANKVIQVTFSEAIKAGSNFWIDLKNSTGTTIPITKTINGNTLTITPTNNLPESKYTLTLHTNSITDIAGNPLTLYTTKFTVGI